jgi:hypothetical protein
MAGFDPKSDVAGRSGLTAIVDAPAAFGEAQDLEQVQ